jgi:hypothetical protein
VRQVLRFLSDILRNRRLRVFVMSWRSPKTLRSAVRILCHAWLVGAGVVELHKSPKYVFLS